MSPSHVVRAQEPHVAGEYGTQLHSNPVLVSTFLYYIGVVALFLNPIKWDF
jgi:hypothetical protein